MAGELCDYGTHLGSDIRGDNDPPFENTYADYAKYLDVLAGVNVDAVLQHFRDKLDAAAAEGYPSRRR